MVVEFDAEKVTITLLVEGENKVILIQTGSCGSAVENSIGSQWMDRESYFLIR